MNDDKERLELKNPTIHQRNENCQVFNGPISGCVFAMPGATVNHTATQQVNARQMPCEGERRFDADALAKVLERCKAFIWGNAAYATVFCVCRDLNLLENNASRFERMLAEGGTKIPDGTINNAMSRNPWMKHPADKWEKYGVKERVLKLRDEFRRQIEEEKEKV